MLDTAVLFLVFNRPETTSLVFNEIRNAKPKRLYVAADGPRADNAFDFEKCEKVKQIIIDNIDWDCQLHTLFRDSNKGCGIGIHEAIDWFFRTEESGIILEDDCLPSASFFRFCQSMLLKYKDHTTVAAISGTNILGTWNLKQPHFFSYYGGNWGWATWRQVWIRNNFWELNKGSTNTYPFLNKIFNSNRKQVAALTNIFNDVKADKLAHTHIWDVQWFYFRLQNGLLSIVPSKNLIKNIGFENGTHTVGNFDFQIERHEITINENFTPPVKADLKFDFANAVKYQWIQPSITSRIKKKVISFFTNRK